MNSKKRFKKFYIEITNVCNLNCSFCPTTMRTPEFISVAMFDKFATEAKIYTDYLYLHVKGEPLLHPELDSILTICDKLNLNVTITTNGTRIRSCQDVLLAHSCIRQVNFSLHSFFGNQSSIGKKDLESFEIHNIDYFKDIFNYANKVLDSNHTNISYRLWNLGFTTNSVNSKTEIIKENLSSENKSILTAIADAHKVNISSSLNRGNKLKNCLYLNFEEEFQWPALEEEIVSEYGFCYALRNQIAVLVDGTVVPCCLDGEGIISLGNLKQESLVNILNKDRTTKLQDNFSKRIVTEELCKKCGYRIRFGI